MNAYRDNEPLTYVGRLPVYVATLIAAVHLVGMIFVSAKTTASINGFLQPFTPDAVFMGGKWWLPFTYTLVDGFSFFSVLGLFFLYRGAVEVERFYGRWDVLKLLAAFVLLPVFIATAFWAVDISTFPLASSGFMSLAYFVAFATLYPNIGFFFGLTPKIVAIFLVAFYCVSFAIQHNLFGVGMVLTTCWFAHFYIVRLRTNGELGLGQLFRGLRSFKPQRKPKLVVLPNPVRREIPKAEMAEPADDAEVDALLDKIAKSGLASLSPAEKARLERAREELLKKERR